jgi:hypothetical protein
MRFVWVGIVVLSLGAVEAEAQPSVAVATKVGVRQFALTGLLENPPVTGTRIKGSTITGTTTARVRSNAPWTLRVSLVAPVNPNLEASFRLGRGREVELSASRRSAVVTSGPTPCVRCSVTLEWEFEYKVKGKTKVTPTVPKLLFEAVPTAGR